MSDSLLLKLSKAVSFVFKSDATCPGITVSTLKDGSVYASVVRYDSSFARGKKVVCSVSGSPNVDVAIESLSKKFLGTVSVPTNPLDELKNSVK